YVFSEKSFHPQLYLQKIFLGRALFFKGSSKHQLKFARCETSTLSPDMDFDLIFGFYVYENLDKILNKIVLQRFRLIARDFQIEID
ncbi:hypothetical protein BpHYR1_032122, partial [Brachionus plicatilis]